MPSARQCSAQAAAFAQILPFTGLLVVGVAWCSPCTDTSPGRAGGKSGRFTKKIWAPGMGWRWPASKGRGGMVSSTSLSPQPKSKSSAFLAGPSLFLAADPRTAAIACSPRVGRRPAGLSVRRSFGCAEGSVDARVRQWTRVNRGSGACGGGKGDFLCSRNYAIPVDHELPNRDLRRNGWRAAISRHAASSPCDRRCASIVLSASRRTERFRGRVALPAPSGPLPRSAITNASARNARHDAPRRPIRPCCQSTKRPASTSRRALNSVGGLEDLSWHFGIGGRDRLPARSVTHPTYSRSASTNPSARIRGLRAPPAVGEVAIGRF